MGYLRAFPQNITPKGTNVQQGFENDDKEFKRIYEILSNSGAFTLAGSKRQSVLYGPTDSDGNPNFLETSGLSVNINGSVKPIILAFAGGFSSSAGTVDFLDKIDTATSNAWTLPANSTCYLFIDKDIATGLLSYGYTSLPDQYLKAAPANPVLNQHYFNTVEMKMYCYNGSSWEEKRRVFVASAIATTTAISVSPYPLRSPIDKTNNIWSLPWTEKFILSAPMVGYVSPPLPLSRDGTCTAIKFYPDGIPSAATNVYMFKGQTSIISNISATDTTVIIGESITTPAPFYALIDKEIVQVTSISGNSMVVSRGQLGTPATTHTTTSKVSTSIGMVSLSTSAVTTLSMNNLSATSEDLFFYVVTGSGLSSICTTILQRWMNR